MMRAGIAGLVIGSRHAGGRGRSAFAETSAPRDAGSECAPHGTWSGSTGAEPGNCPPMPQAGRLGASAVHAGSGTYGQRGSTRPIGIAVFADWEHHRRATSVIACWKPPTNASWDY